MKKKALTAGFPGLFLMLLVAGLLLNGSHEVPAGTSISGQLAEVKEQAAPDREQVKRFYEALERVLNAYGTDHTKWPESEDKRLIRDYLDGKDALTFDNCIFGTNLLGLGMGETTYTAEEALRRGQKDAWDHPYETVLASSVRAPRPFELLFAIAENRGAPLFNREICKKVYVFLKADLHSQFADVFKNFNGETVLIMAREINIMGAPGSAAKGYAEGIGPALCAADCLSATVYLGKEDRVTRVTPHAIRDTIYALFGIDLPVPEGKDRKAEACPREVPVRVVYLEACGHEVNQYHLGMKRNGSCLLKRKDGLP